MNLKTVIFLAALSLSSPLLATEKIATQEQAKKFLEQYCLEIVNEIATAVDRQRGHAARNEWEAFVEQGGYISGLSEIYGNLCKPVSGG